MKTVKDATSLATETVFLGGVQNFGDLLDPAVAAALAGRSVGLYSHATGVMFYSSDIGALSKEFSGQGSGVAELGMSFGYAQATVELRNDTRATQYLYVGTKIDATNGTQFEILDNQHATLNGTLSTSIFYDNAAGAYYYVLRPGDDLVVRVGATGLGTAANVAAGSINQFETEMPLTVVGSTAATGGEGWTSLAENGVVTTVRSADGSYTNTAGFLTNWYGQYGFLYHTLGLSPLQTNVNVDTTHAWTQREVQSWEAYVDNARAEGLLNVAPITSDNDYTADLSGNFATNPWYAGIREAALYGGGLSFDTPPNFFFSSQQAYRDNITQQIQWANANGLRSSMIISPYDLDGAPNGVDDSLLAATKQLVAYLQQHNAMPSQFIVENYNGVERGQYFDPNDPNSLTSVALYLSTVTLAPTNSEAGQETVGGNAAVPDVMVSGQAGNVTINSVATQVLANTRVYSIDPTEQVTATVSIDTLQYGAMVDGSGVWFTTKTYTGTAADVTKALEQVVFGTYANTIGNVTLNITVADKAGSVSTTSKIAVDTIAAPSVATTDRLLLNVSADIWTHAPQFTVLVDGKQYGGVFSTSALASRGDSDNILITGNFGQGSGPGGAHQITVDFLNDECGGAGKDTNLYVNSATLDGVTQTISAVQLSSGSASYWSAPQSADSLQVISNVASPVLSGTGRPGDVITVVASRADSDTALGTASVAADGSWSLHSSTVLAQGTYSLKVTQTDAAGRVSAPATVQSLLVDTHTPGAPGLYLAVDTLSLNVSADTGSQPAQFTVTVDGQQVGGIYSTSASKSAGASDTITLSGTFGVGKPHNVAVNFLGDASGGSSQAASLYVNSITYDGVTTLTNGAQSSAGAANYVIAASKAQGAMAVYNNVTTDSSRPHLQGWGDPGATVLVQAISASGSTQTLGTALVSPSGDWSLTPATPLAAGSYVISGVLTDIEGTASPANLWLHLTVASSTTTTGEGAGSGTVQTSSVTGMGTMTFIGNADTIQLQSGAAVTEIGAGNTWVMPAAGQASLFGASPAGGDVLDLRAALAAVGWTPGTGTPSSYLTVNQVNGGADLDVITHRAGSSLAVSTLHLAGMGTVNPMALLDHVRFA